MQERREIKLQYGACSAHVIIFMKSFCAVPKEHSFLLISLVQPTRSRVLCYNYIASFLCDFTDYPGDRSDCHVMRGSKVSASFFTYKLLAVSGNIRTAATTQGAAAACREIGFDILHYIPEGRCNSRLKNNAATRDMNTQKQQTSFPRWWGQKRQTYAIICQRK